MPNEAPQATAKAGPRLSAKFVMPLDRVHDPGYENGG
jgi:hypothetical protein